MTRTGIGSRSAAGVASTPSLELQHILAKPRSHQFLGALQSHNDSHVSGVPMVSFMTVRNQQSGSARPPPSST